MARALAASPPYRILARRVVLPWTLQGERLAGEGLEIGLSLKGPRGGDTVSGVLTRRTSPPL